MKNSSLIKLLQNENISPVVIALNEQLHFLMLNDKAEEVFQLSASKGGSKSFIAHCTKVGITFSIDAITLERVLSSSKPDKNYHLIVDRTDFKRTFLMSVLSIISAVDGSRQILMIGYNIEEIHQINDEARAIKNYLDYIINNVPHFIFWKDQHSQFLGCNRKFADSAGLDSPRAIIGKTDFDMPWFAEAAKYSADDKKIMSSKKAMLDYEEEQTQFDAELRTMLVSKVPMFHNDKVCGVLGIYTDITDRKNAEIDLKHAKEEAESATRSKSEFLENMRHDLRTPLSGIMGFARLIKSEAENSKIAEYADHLVTSSQALMDFLNEVLDIIKISNGEISVEKRKFKLRDKIQHVIDLNLAKAVVKNIELRLNYDPALPDYLYGDSKRLHRILMELISNALNFTDQGQVCVDLNLLSREGREIVLQVRVKDTGIGVPLPQQKTIFLRFNRVHPVYEGIYHGTGVGLSVVKQFIDDLDGEIYLESELGKGSTFTCIFPFKIALTNDDIGVEKLSHTSDLQLSPEDFSVERAEISKDPDAPPQELNQILLIEDEPLAAKVGKYLLETLNCQVDIAYNGNDALHCFKQKSYDLIFMDIGLPDLNGCEVARNIRQSGFPLIPIVALTAHIDTDNKLQCIEAGMDEVLAKPLTFEVATRVLEKYLSSGKFHST